MNTGAFWVAIVAALLAGLFAALQMSLRNASRSRLKERATREGLSDRLAPILDDIGGHALAVSLPRVLRSIRGASPRPQIGWLCS